MQFSESHISYVMKRTLYWKKFIFLMWTKNWAQWVYLLCAEYYQNYIFTKLKFTFFVNIFLNNYIFLRKKKTDSQSRNRRCEHRPPQEAGRKAVERGIVGHLPISSLVIHAGKALLRRNAFSQVEKGWRCFGCSLPLAFRGCCLGKTRRKVGGRRGERRPQETRRREGDD